MVEHFTLPNYSTLVWTSYSLMAGHIIASLYLDSQMLCGNTIITIAYAEI